MEIINDYIERIKQAKTKLDLEDIRMDLIMDSKNGKLNQTEYSDLYLLIYKAKQYLKKYGKLKVESYSGKDLLSIVEEYSMNEELNRYVYHAKFRLTNPVNDYDAAYEYLIEDDMTQYIPDELKDVVESVVWDLQTDQKGRVIVTTNRELTPEESDEMSDWISGQNSDGLGEGFEQQDFANNYPERDEWGNIEDDGDTNMASFDWETNDYKLILVSSPTNESLNEDYFEKDELSDFTDDELLRLRGRLKEKSNMAYNRYSKALKNNDNSNATIYGIQVEANDKAIEEIERELANRSRNEEMLEEDTVKQGNKWVNKGDSGKTHGKFRTKKAADAQRKAMFAQGYEVKESVGFETTPIFSKCRECGYENYVPASSYKQKKNKCPYCDAEMIPLIDNSDLQESFNRYLEEDNDNFDKAVNSCYIALKNGAVASENIIQNIKFLYNLSYDQAKKALYKAHNKYMMEDESLEEAYSHSDGVVIGKATLKKEDPDWINYSQYPNYDERVTALPSTVDVRIYPYNIEKNELGHSAYWAFDAVDRNGKKDFARTNCYIYQLDNYFGDDKNIKIELNNDWEWSDKYPHLIKRK